MAISSIPMILMVFAIPCILVAVFISYYPPEADRRGLVLEGLQRAEKRLPVRITRPKVAVGFGACYDVFLESIEQLKALNVKPSGRREHKDTVHSEEELEQLFNYFFSFGAAAERYIDSQELFSRLVRSAQSSRSARWAVGGNAPVMAARMASEGCEILLGSRTSPNVRFAPHVTGIGEQEKDDIHIIYEYDKNDIWGEIVSPRANRLIVHNDHYNPTLNMIEEFQEQIIPYNPRLFVLGGLQMMDNYPFKSGVRKERLSSLESLLHTLPDTTLIHFEMASFSELKLLQELVGRVLPNSDSLGMNEQELPNILAVLQNKPITLVADSNPRVAQTLDEMRQLFAVIEQADNKRRQLTRIHVHTLAYQAILTVKSSAWNHTDSACSKASLTANRYVCGEEKTNINNSRLILDESFSSSTKHGASRINLDDDSPVACWSETISNIEVLICVAPNLVCTAVKQTGGAGDNISSAALAAQLS